MDKCSNIFFSDTDFNLILDPDFLTELERSVLNNDLDKIKLLISRGETLYSVTKLCNGYLDRKYKIVHSRCLKNICYKTAVYYSFIVNYVILKNIYHYFKKYGSDNYDVCSLIGELEKCSCGCEYSCIFNLYYNSSNFSFFKFSNKILELLNDAKKILPVDLSNSTVSEPCSIKFNFKNIECIYDDKFLLFNSKMCILSLHNMYENSCAIIKLLLDQQSFEIYKFYLINNLDIYHQINNIYKDTLANINYINPHDNKSILTLTLHHIDDDNLLNYLLEKGAIIPENINVIIKECLNMGFYKSIKILIKKISPHYLYTPFCLFREILQNNSIQEEEKINIMQIIEDRHNVDIDGKLLIDILNSSISLKCFNIIINNKKFTDNIDQSIISHCIMSKKYMDLDLLLKYGRNSLIDGENLHQIPLFVYLKETISDDPENLNILNTLLRFNPKLDILNAFNESPLLISTKKNRLNSTLLLLNRGANPFIRDINNDNCLHIAIKNNYDELVEILCKYKSEGIYLVNEPTVDMSSCLTMCLVSNDPTKYFKYLIGTEGINLNYIDSKNKNILYYVISNNTLTDDIKYKLLVPLIDKNLNLKEICNNDKDIMLMCIEKEYFNIIRLLINKLVELKEILIDDTDIISALRNSKIKIYQFKNTYSSAISYLRQNIFKFKVPDSNSNLCDPTKNNMCVAFIFMLIFLALGLIEKRHFSE